MKATCIAAPEDLGLTSSLFESFIRFNMPDSPIQDRKLTLNGREALLNRGIHDRRGITLE